MGGEDGYVEGVVLEEGVSWRRQGGEDEEGCTLRPMRPIQAIEGIAVAIAHRGGCGVWEVEVVVMWRRATVAEAWAQAKEVPAVAVADVQ